MAYIYDIADTWSGGGAFTGIKLNVTDSGSTAGSMLMDLQVGGVSRFSVGKTGSITVSGTSGYANSGILFAGAGPRLYANSNIFVVNNASYGMFGCEFGTTQARINGGVAFGFSSGDVTTSLDVILARDAANTLAQRNGVNAQAFNLYNTYTDASNYERGFMRFVSNALQIGSEKLGTGTARALAFQTDGVTRMTIEAGGAVSTAGSLICANASGVLSSGYLGSWFLGRIGFSNGASLAPGSTLDTYISRSAQGILAITDAAELTEMVAPAAPAANKVRIYTEDNGSGKTRLMALFATGAAVQIAIEP